MCTPSSKVPSSRTVLSDVSGRMSATDEVFFSGLREGAEWDGLIWRTASTRSFLVAIIGFFTSTASVPPSSPKSFSGDSLWPVAFLRWDFFPACVAPKHS